MNRFTVLMAIAAIACSEAPETAEDSAKAATTIAEQTQAEAKKALIPPGESAPAQAPASQPVLEHEKADDWQVTFAGIGSLRAGMSLDEAQVVMRNGLVVPAKLEACDYIKPRTGLEGVAIMVENETVSRVDITSRDIATVAGARIGDTEEKIKSLYAGQVQVKPHKYTDGHYLVVTQKGGGNNRIVFETDGKKVLRYRSGRLPAVEYVEGCA